MLSAHTIWYRTQKYRLGWILWLTTAAAIADTPRADANDEPVIESLKPFEDTHATVSQQVLRFADWLDSFFANTRYYDESQNSYLKLNLIHVRREKGDGGYSASLKGKLTLPNTQRRFKLLLESESDETLQESDSSGQQPTPVKAMESQEQTLGLRYIGKDTLRWRISTDAGIRLRATLDPFVRLRIRRRFLAGHWTARLTETLFWFDSLGLGETTRLNIDRDLGEHYLFRSTTKATWREQTRAFDLGQSLQLFHDISHRRVVAYQASANGVTKPDTHVTSYLLSVRLRQQLHRDWLFFEINPRVLYPQETNYRPEASLVLTLESIFGATRRR